MPTLEATSRGELQSARLESERLFDIIRPEHVYDRPIDARHRVIFYIGHLDGFDSIQICREGLGIPSPDPSLDTLFQAGIDPDSGHLPSDQPSDWPSIEQVLAYCKRCRQHVDKHLDHAPADVVNMALEHRLMHLETLAYMFHNFDYAAKRAPDSSRSSTGGDAPMNSWCEVSAGDAVLGKMRDGSFGWDNEYDLHRVHVPKFLVQRFPVTNGAYLEFVNDGASAPNFWIQRDGQWYVRGMFEPIPLPLDWPVYVTQQQAEAYARWCGCRVMSEPEFHRAAYASRSEGFPWGTAEPTPRHGNFDFNRWDPVPVTATPLGDSPSGVAQLVGNGWEWTASEFAPFAGFQATASYPGYSSNFFDGEHFVMKGASSRTSARLMRPSFRNWFRRDYPYMYSKFRCVADVG
jgi:formylglycine-generating enzyme required for sulfatase activity